MADCTVKRIEDFEAIFGGGFKRVRAGLGVSSFGLAVMDLPAGFDFYPEHTHDHDAQEEVYAVLEGQAFLEVGGDGGERHELVPGVWARVGPGEPRRIWTEGQAAQLVAIGGTPGEPYEPPDFTEEGAPAHMDKA